MENVLLFGLGVAVIFFVGYLVSKTRKSGDDNLVGGLPEPRERPGKDSNK